MPAERYCEREGVSPARAKSKSLVASSMASGGSWETEVGLSEVGGADCGGVLAVAWGRPIVCGVWLVAGIVLYSK